MTRFSSLRSFAGAAGRSGAVLAAGALLLSACQSKPTGQVAASVDGDEITTTELNAELTGVQMPKGADPKVLQRQALQRVIDRKLLANAAREESLDQSPEFVIRRQQLEDGLLAQLLTQKIARGLKAPVPGDVDKFMASNPSMFAGRSILTVDQIRFPTPAREEYLKQLGAAHSMSQVTSKLDQLNIKYQRGNAQIDTAQLPPQVAEQIRKLPAGEPFVIPAGNLVVVSLVTNSQPAPLGGEAVRPLAMNGARNAKLGEALQQRLKTEQGKAKIDYQPGFAPTADMKAGGAPGAAPAAK